MARKIFKNMAPLLNVVYYLSLKEFNKFNKLLQEWF